MDETCNIPNKSFDILDELPKVIDELKKCVSKEELWHSIEDYINWKQFIKIDISGTNVLRWLNIVKEFQWDLYENIEIYYKENHINYFDFAILVKDAKKILDFQFWGVNKSDKWRNEWSITIKYINYEWFTILKVIDLKVLKTISKNKDKTFYNLNTLSVFNR